MKFAQLKVQRAMRTIEISRHPSFMPIVAEHNEMPGIHDIHIQPRPDLPRQQQPAATSLRNGSIYMISRNVPSKSVRPGMVLLLNLQRAAAVLADDTYEIASEEQMRVELERQAVYRKFIADEDRRMRMANQGIENNINVVSAPQPPINVQVMMPEGFNSTPAGYKLVPIDTPYTPPAQTQSGAPPVRRRGRPRSSANVAAAPAQYSDPNTANEPFLLGYEPEDDQRE